MTALYGHAIGQLAVLTFLECDRLYVRIILKREENRVQSDAEVIGMFVQTGDELYSKGIPHVRDLQHNT